MAKGSGGAGRTRNVSGIWSVADAKNVTKYARLIMVGIAGANRGKIIAAEGDKGHETMLYYAMDHFPNITASTEDNIDNYVRFVVEGPGRMYTNTFYAGVVSDMGRGQSSPAFRANAMKTINRALNSLVGRGMPKNTRVDIYDGTKPEAWMTTTAGD